MKKILISDDSKLVREVLKGVLQKCGYEVIEADNGNSAFNLAAEELPDLIILDFMMPECTGFEATKKIRGDSRTKNIPIIICTGSEGVYNGFNKDASTTIQAFLEKPCKSKAMLKKISQILGDV